MPHVSLPSTSPSSPPSPSSPSSALLIAAREADEALLRAALRDILLNGIAANELNAADACGRTPLSYVCSTNLTPILDVLLQMPGIDVNLADKEGNTPLHFAAQSGQSDTVNMLLTRSRSVAIDARNHMGFTPLMKAALQGRTRCAKLLLFAGASPVAVDNGRGFRAEQWARFCGRYTCAEMIETCARARLMDKATSCQWAHDTQTFEQQRPASASGGSDQPQQQRIASKDAADAATAGHQANGIRSKLKKVFSFNLKDRLSLASTKKGRVQDRTDFSSYFASAKKSAENASEPRPAPLPVPKLEVTPATNQTLIRKYERLYGADSTASVIVDAGSTSSPQSSPKLPPRCKVRSRN